MSKIQSFIKRLPDTIKLPKNCYEKSDECLRRSNERIEAKKMTKWLNSIGDNDHRFNLDCFLLYGEGIVSCSCHGTSTKCRGFELDPSINFMFRDRIKQFAKPELELSDAELIEKYIIILEHGEKSLRKMNKNDLL